MIYPTINMSKEVPLAKYNVYMYIGCIADQSNWSGPSSLLIITPDLESSDLGSRPGWGMRLEVSIYRSISPSTTFGAWCQYDYCPSLRASLRTKLCLRSQKGLGIPKHMRQMFHCSMEE